MTISRTSRLTKLVSPIAFMAITSGAMITLPSQAAVAVDLSRRVAFDIPAQPLPSALMQFSSQAGVEFSASTDLVEGKQVSALKGTYATREALEMLLAGTGLEFAPIDGRVLAIRASSAVTGPSASPGVHWQDRFRLAQVDQEKVTRDRSTSAQDEQSTRNGESDYENNEVDEVVVTGTRVKGAQPSSPIVTITQEEMRLSGHTNLGEVVRALPQSFSGGQNPEVGSGAFAGGNANQNITGSSSFNLRGLGPDATLTLLNGMRLPYDGFVQATDVSVIPVAAIDRVEILLDGASALYGSDAVGGVANIILKRDYEGAEISARYGVATDGGYAQTQYTGIGGLNWGSGGFLTTYDYSHNTAVRVRQRDYLSYMPNSDSTIYPQGTQKGALFSGHQELGRSAELSLDAFYTDRESSTSNQTTTILAGRKESIIYGISPALHFDLPGERSLRLHGSVGRNEGEYHQRVFSVATGAQTSQSAGCNCNEAEAVGLEAEGPLFTLPAGKARVSIGAGYRKNSLQTINLMTGVTNTAGSRRSRYGFGEINLPLVAEAQDVPGVTQLSLNGAVRYENYGSDDFGAVSTPKVGLIWSVTRDLDLKASWGKSFKAPTLDEQYGSRQTFLGLASTFGAVGALAGSTVLGRVGGGSGDLGPERAESFSASFAVHPQFLPGFDIEAGWFYIDYTDRVVRPINPLTQALSNPVFAEFLTRNPTVAQQNAAITGADRFDIFASTGGYDPTRVIAIFDNRNVNATSQKTKGVDLSARFTTNIFGGRTTVSGNASWLDGQRKLSSLAPEFATAGVIFFPAKFRGRAGLSWSRGGLTFASYLDHISGVKNTNITPNPKGASMTTVDLVINYEVDSGSAGDVGFNLAVRNLFDRRPPFLQPTQPYFGNYDTTNYSALGRVVSGTVTKRF